MNNAVSECGGVFVGLAGALWGLLGVSGMLIYAVVRLSVHVTDSLSMTMMWYHWLALVINVVFMAYSEGYKGFQKGFSPRVAARARHLRENPVLMHSLLAPIFCFGFIHTTFRRRLTVLLVTAMIIVLVQLVSLLEQPWRGVVDAGVVVGLVWGLASLYYFSYLALTAQEFAYSAELPNDNVASVNDTAAP